MLHGSTDGMTRMSSIQSCSCRRILHSQQTSSVRMSDHRAVVVDEAVATSALRVIDARRRISAGDLDNRVVHRLTADVVLLSLLGAA